MERKLKNFWILGMTMALTTAAYADNWDSIIRKIANNPKSLTLSASVENSPQYRITPKVVGFQGVVRIPSQVYVTSGYAKQHNAAAQIIIDDQIVCNYAPRSSKSKDLRLVSCSDGSNDNDNVNVREKVTLRLNYTSTERGSAATKISVVRADSISYGLQFPFLTPDEGDVLMYNGSAWVAADPSSIQGLRGESGAQGPQGEMGPQGPAGPQGPQGPKGDAGVAGAQGPKGDKGDPGVAGAAGSVGPQGPAGPAGAVGPQGPAGAPGVAGAQGPQGPAGAVGPMGPQGPKGNDGAPGVAGAQGPQGPAGATGPMGPQGPKGNDGAPGVAGPMGPMGMPGAKGDQGPQGDVGPMGPQGPQGPQGIQGPKGDKGDRGLADIAYIREEQGSGVAGGTCTAGAWTRRNLNVLGGKTDFISIANNQFVLTAGKYFVEISAPAYAVNASKAKLVVVETGTDVLVGSTAYSPNQAAASMAMSVMQGEIIVDQASTFEVQQTCATTRVANGLGIAGGLGVKEVYTQIKIIKTE